MLVGTRTATEQNHGYQWDMAEHRDIFLFVLAAVLSSGRDYAERVAECVGIWRLPPQPNTVFNQWMVCHRTIIDINPAA